ncbi:MAG: Gfo/Idh/MocA family oxidoreductase [Candidatus Latescibacteria bacterium]|nr:Gfo/Idh/MocA family oxidoreductase [Candidatus Latescibacterota bacterium]NIM20941.1 Gfo/Idh/MocA family oxidoreductase [Candidatus Latescibacterota bacterium]NIM65076.1 Gfo/Idh/MocA family oxidoreductase [Candidatus Latescibacterota bacterium]NIO01591.1 Gfo/Idh/MocA family oxidoreductase [Candidatus Latescibacterota bacterium]NIO28108.1 Gfo/Idh/MocA family oxidoreductase [Candidatus Latescibacterota bacterium]
MGLRVGVAGIGKLGREHVRVFKGFDEVDFIGCYDLIEERALQASKDFGATTFSTVQELIDAVDAVSVVVPSTKHAEVAVAALEAGKDVFLEKPIASDVRAAERIVDATQRHQRILQMGHIERFNSAFEAAFPFIQDPSFIEIHRLAPFAARGIDVSVATDLMIHDLDILLLLLKRWPEDIRAKGAGILTTGPDIINARLEFANGCVANLTSSRVSVEPMRKIRVFSPNRYLSIDLFRRRVKRYEKGEKFKEGVARLKELEGSPGVIDLSEFLTIEEFETHGDEPLAKELKTFCRSVLTRKPPPVTGEDGLNALKLAEAVLDKIERESTTL